ncbi:MAG: hypothetical protein M3Q30_11390 [Actinomycetota bacterium]|nr:hypothetical protein [Actinomycetota bacterium]
MPREFQLIGYLRLLAENGVEYLLVGGVGARIQGTATTTQDIDVMPEPSEENLARLAQALSHEETEKKESSAIDYRPHAVVNPMEFRTSDVSSFRTRFGVIDVLMELPGVGPFDAVRRNVRRYEWQGIIISVASIDDIITSKETADRAKDRRALDALYAARDHLREHPDPYELSEVALDPEREIDES